MSRRSADAVAGLEIGPAGAADFETLTVLHGACFDEPWGPNSIARLLEPRGSFALLARLAGRPVGFLLCRRILGEAEVLSIGVAPEARRCGIGTRLLAAALARARAGGDEVACLEVAADNDAARALYAAQGFAPTGRRPGYYARPGGRSISAILLRRTLSEAGGRR